MALVEGASPPVFEQIFRNARFAQGGNALFEGKVRGNPKPQVVWTRKGLQMKGNEKHQMLYDDMSGKVSLMIKAIGPGDEGEYTCTALNPYGEAICTVYISPEATKQVKKSRSSNKLSKSNSNKQVQMMQQQQIQQQQQQQFMQQQQFSSQQQSSSFQQVSSMQQSSMSFQESSMMKSSQQSSTSFSSMKQQSSMMSSQQQHSFQQSQAIKVAEPEVIYLKPVERSVQQPRHDIDDANRYPAPTFLTPLRDLNIVEGEKAHFDAKVAPVGDPTMRVEWFYNGKAISASSRVNTTCQFGFVSLDMLNSTTSDTGEYTCVVKNESGVIQSNCRLVVNPRRDIELEYQHSQSLRQVEMSQQQVVHKVIEEEPPQRPEFVRPLVASMEKAEGSNIHFEAQVTPVSDHTMKIEWMKDGRAITASSRIGTLFNFGYVSLNINGLRVEDAGTYICRAVNAAGEAFTTTTLKVTATVDLTASTGIAEQETYIKKVQQLESYQASKMMTRQESTVEPTQAPEFVTSIKDQLEVREGGFSHFEARLEPMGDHTMKVEWLKDGRPVDASSRITSFFNFGYVALTIKQVALHDAGQYTCVASNRCGRAEVTAKLTTISKADSEFRSKAWSSIQQLESSKQTTQMSFMQQEVSIAPKFVSQLKGTNIILEGQRAHFECRIEPQNDPTLKIEWLHNGQQLKASSRIQTHFDFGYVAIDIIDAKKEDSGTYTLIASNALGSQKTTVELKVDAHSQYVDHSTIHAKTVEETRKFEMKQEVRQEMVIPQEVTSLSKPVFRTPLQDPQPVTEGQNIHLEARLEPIGDPFMRVEWLCNGRPLTIGSRFRTYNDFGFIALDIISVNTSDAGKYVCRATNQLGQAETIAQVSVSAKTNIITETEHESALEQISYLETVSEQKFHHSVATTEQVVVQQPPVFSKMLKNVEVVEGQNVHLEARLSPTGDSSMKVEWTLNGKPLKTGHKIRPAYDFDYVALDLLSIYPEESGVYTCHARNAYGQAETSASVKVTGAAQVVTESRSEMSQFQYLEQKQQVKQEIIEEHTTQAPVFTSTLKSVELKEGQKAHFECRIIPVSDPTLKIQWLLNGKPIKQGSRFREGLDFGFVSLDILHVYAEDAGTYTCKATNVLGQAVNSADLIVKAKETIVKDTIHQAAVEQIQYLEQPRLMQTQEEGFTTQAPAFTCSMRDIQLVEGMPAHFEAKLVPVGDPKLRVDWLKDGKPIQASNRMSTLHDFGFVAFDLKYTRPDDTGTYTCKARNALGEAVISANLKVLSAKEGPMADSLHGEALHKIAYLEKKQTSLNLAEEEDIQSAPKFVVALQGKTSLIEGQNVHIECRIEPYPDSTLNVEWFRNDKPLPFGNRWRTSYDFGFAALDIIGAYAEDSGRYTLRAKNVLGSAESHLDVKISPRSGLLLDSEHSDALEKIKYLESKHQRTAEEEMAVSEAPRFGHNLKDIRLDEGQSAHFETTLTPVNDASMKVQWLCNGKPVPQGHRFRTTYDFGFVALDILYAYSEDSGTYSCHATNMIGETSTSCRLDVSAKAGLLLDTMDRDRLAQLRNLEMRERPRPTEGDAPITKPVFTTALNNADGVPEQSRVHLECRLEPVNDPNLRVEWFVNGKSIKTGHRFRTTHDFGYVALDILYAYPEDTGTYMCKAVNKLGEAVNTCSVEVVGRKGLLLDSQHPEGWEKMKSMESRGTFRRLEVEETPVGPPHFVTQLVGTNTLAEGQIAHFEAQIEPINDPNLKIEFFHNGKPIQQASRIHTLCDFGYVALDIAQLVVSDAGEYKCRAYNKHGESFSIIHLKISGQDTLDTSSQRPEGLEKIRQLESKQSRKLEEEVHTFQKPVFTQPLQNIEKEENHNARFTARLIPVGDPTLKVDWYQNGKLLSKGTRINTVHDFGCVSLDITGLRSSDEGVYECKATNSLGEAVTTASCKVFAKGSLLLDSQHPEGMRKITELERTKVARRQVSDDQQAFEKPVFVTPLSGTDMVAEGQQAHMECRVVPLGDSSMKFQWFKNGESLQMGSRFHVTQDFGFVTLDIASCVAEDSGMYMVKAVNLTGEASSSFALHVGGKSGVMGEALHPDSYKKIQALEAEKSTRRQISEDGAIVQPPVFMEQLKEVGVVAEGSNIFLEAKIEPKNDSNLKVEWELNGTPLKPGSRLKTSLDFGHVQLQLNDVRFADSGIYTCKAINLLGEAVSTTSIKVEESSGVLPATSKETGPPKFVSTFSESYSISEGQSCHMEARLTPVDDPNMKVEWFKDGKPLPTGHRFRTFHDFGIVILDILYCFAEDTGVYECRATNKLGSDAIKCSVKCSEKSGLILTPQVPGEMKQHTMERIQHLESMKMKTFSQSSTVVSSVAPRFTVPITNIENMKEGENAHFEARLIPTDDPNLSVEWFWNGKALKAGSRIRTFCDFGFVILEISPVYPEDAGEYMCRAKNALGEAVTSATLKCSGKRNIIMDSQLPKGMEGAIDKIANLEGLGRFRAAENISDDIDQPPEFLSSLEDLLLGENSLAHFETRLTPINDPSMRVEWYHNGKNLSAGSRIKTINDFGFVILEVANVLTRDSGNYTCKATNRHGEASISCNVVVKSKQDIITDPQLPKSFRTGTESIQRLEENRWRREEMIEDSFEAKPPKFVTSIKDVTIVEGQPAHFDCRVEPVGDGSMKIEWYHDGQPIQIGSRIHTISDFGFVVLDIDWTFKRDSGIYVCRATNKCGTAEVRANLTCKSKKDINLDSQLPDGMSLDKLKELEKGKRQDRTEEAEAEITAPKFITQLKSRAVGEGEPAHFNCRVEPKHDPKLSIKWFHNDHELASGHRFRITHEFGYVALDILYTYPEDEGEYVCKAFNELGEDITKCELKCKELPAIQLENQVPKGMKKSEYLVQMEAAMKKYTQEIFLTEDDVYDAEKRQPPRFVTQIQSVTDLVEMQATKFECQLAPVGDPHMKVEWFFNGKALPYKNRFTPIFDFGYVAMNFSWVYPEDSGEYVCRASNLYGMDETRGILKTTGKPGIIYESQLPKGMASIERIREMESGWQRAPELIESEAERFKPCFVTKPEAQVVQEGDAVRFCCRVTGYPKPRVMWLLNGHTVINGSKHKLIYDGMWHFDIPKCRDIDAGKVEVIARNQCGEAYASTTLEVTPRQDDYRSVLRHNVKRDYINSKEYRKPEWLTRMEEIQKRLAEQQHSAKITQELREVRVKEGMKAKFEASFAGNPKPDIIWQFNGVEIVSSDRVKIKIRDNKTTLTIQDVTFADGGQYTVRCRNDLGSDNTRAGLTVSKPGEEPVPKPKPVEKPAKKADPAPAPAQPKPAFKREVKKPEPPKPEPQKQEPFQLKKAAPKTIPKPEEKPAPGIDVKLKRTQQVSHEKSHEEVKVPQLKHVEKAPAGGEVEHDGAGEHQLAQLKHVDNKPKHEEVKPEAKPKKAPKPEEPKPKKVAPRTEAPGPIEVKSAEVTEATEMTSEVRQQITTELKKAGITEVQSEMVVASSQQAETGVSTVQKAEIVAQEPALDIKEGDTFYALATFVSETGEAMNLVEGERVYVLEWNNQDWWYVRKHLTEESGWVPAQYLKDDQTYTMYVQKKLVEKIEKLPVFDKPKAGEATFAPKIIEGVHSASAPDGSQVEFVCKVEGNPRPQITWFRQTAIIKPSQDFQIFYYDDNKATLVIKEVFPEDAGTFTCVAKNCVGFASSSAELTVQHPVSEHGGFEKHDRRSMSRESSLADIVEGIPPTFAQRPQTKTAEEGTSTELECRFVAIPEADVQWYHNKVELKESKRVSIQHQADMHMYCSIIKITDIKKEDAGTYEVTARNREGEATNTLVLNVTPKAEAPNTPPNIVKPLTATVCKVGEAIKMETVITGKPKPKLEWLHNGSPISMGENLRLIEKDNIFTLSIESVTMDNDGEYTVKASNASGSVQTSANLSVQENIEFVGTLEDVEIKEQNTIEMHVEVSNEDSKVKWYKDGEVIPENDDHFEFKRTGRKHSIVIKNVTVHQEGEYIAAVGDQECSCELTVIELPPVFTKKIEPQTVTAGEEKAVFEIELSKGDAITKWFKDGKEIDQSEHVQLKIDGKKQRLEIHNVELTDAGEVSCTIGNEKCQAKLVVEEPKVNFVAKLAPVTTGTVGQDVKISVTLTNANAQASWLKEGKTITESSKYSFEVEGASRTIVIKGASIEDIGKYTCVAENVRTETELELQGAKEQIEVIESELEKEKVAIKGQDTTFTINFKQSYLEKPNVQWFFNSKSIAVSERIVTTSSRKSASITIKQVENIDCGTYTAKISNSSSEVSVDFTLSVKDKPSSPQGPASVEWTSEGSMELRWNVPESDGGSAIIEYIVERREVGKKSWKQVGTSSQTSTEIRGLKKDTSYNFRVIAKNSVGCSAPFIIEETFTAATAVKPIPKGVPGPPNNVQVTDVTSRSVTLQWSPPFNTGGVELTGYIIEKRLATTHKWERLATVDTSCTLYTIENLKEKSQYYFRVSAENEIGAGETAATEKVSLQTHARPPSSPSAPLEIVPLGPHSIMVEWGAPESDGGAPLEGYKVAVRDAKRHMWMEVGRVSAEVQKLKVQELVETHDYFIRIYAKNEVGFSEPLENEEPFKVVRPADYNEEEAEAEAKHDDTPSLSFSTTETLSSWMREANMDADIQSYTKSSILRRDEYFFRIWYYASKIFK